MWGFQNPSGLGRPLRHVSVILCTLIGLVGSASGWTSQEVEPPRYRPLKPLDLKPRAKTNTIRGIITDTEKRPIAGATVTAESPGEDGSVTGRRQERSNDTGRFEFRDLSDGIWNFGAEHPDYATAWIGSASAVTPSEDRATTIRLKLWKPVDFSARVVDIKGRPVSGVRVTLIRETLPDGSFPQPNSSSSLRETTTDEDGVFRFERMNPGNAGFFLEKEGFAKTYPMTVDLSSSAVTLELDPGLTLRGQVIENGSPVADTIVTVSSIKFAHRDMGSIQVKTDADGHFEVPCVADLTRYEGMYNLRVVSVVVGDVETAANYYDVYKSEDGTLPFVTADPTRRRAGEQVRAIALGQVRERNPSSGQLIESGTGSIRILNGFDPRKTMLTLSRVDKPADSPILGFRPEPDERGIIFRNLPIGRYRVVPNVQYASPFVSPTEITLGDGEQVELTLKSGRAALDVKITCGDLPLPTGSLSLRLSRTNEVLQFVVELDGSDTYRLEGLEPAEYSLRLHPGENSLMYETPIKLRSGANQHDLVVPTGEFRITIAGDTLDPSMSRGLRTFFLQRVGPRDAADAIHAKWAETGLISLRHIPPGLYSISTAIAYQPARWAFGTARIPDSGGPVEIQLKSPEHPGAIGGSVRLSVNDVPQHEFAAKCVFAQARDSRQGAPGFFAGEVDEDGNYQITGLPPGAYVVWMGAVSSKLAPPILIPNVRVRPGQERVLDLDVPEGRQVQLHVADLPVEGKCTFSLVMPNGAIAEAEDLTRWNTGVFHAETTSLMLAPGSYTIRWQIAQTLGVRDFDVTPGQTPLSVEIDRP